MTIDMKKSFKMAFFLVIFLTTFSPSHAKESQQVATPKMLDQLLHSIVRTRINQQQVEYQDSRLHFTIVRVILAGCLCFSAASVSSAGGIGEGGLFIPILTLVAGLGLKTATSFSALMVTGSSIPNVVSSMFKKNGDKPLIDFGIALFSEPCNLVGVSVGEGLIPLKPCGLTYWIISALQIPLAIILTLWILCTRGRLRKKQELDNVINVKEPNKIMYPAMGFLAGALGGTFGIGGGMLISPLLLQVGIPPRVTSATSSFMVFFSFSMAAFQYILLGMEHIEVAGIFAVACFVGSIIGLGMIQRAIEKHGRPSLIVFSVGLVLAFSTVLMTSTGGIHVWRDYTSGIYMGFKQPCK